MSERVGVVGVVGGGQLARMMVEAAGPLGLDLVVLAHHPGEGAAVTAPRVVLGDATDPEALRELASAADVVTFDHELVPPRLVEALEAEGVVVRPGSGALRIASDKVLQRAVLGGTGIPFAPHARATTLDDVQRFLAETGGPIVAKAATGGYDGRGVWWVRDDDDARAVADAVPPGGELLLEPVLDLEAEVSAIVARSVTGEIVHYPLVRTHQRHGTCHAVEAPAGVPAPLAAEAASLAARIAEAIDIVGILAVELFVVGGRLLVNELAPRPHNSGHLTIEACVTSQFENHLRAVLGLPLGSADLAVPAAAMVNVIPTTDALGPLAGALRDPAAKVHLYGKEPRVGRKSGHVTVCGSDLADVRARAELVAAGLASPTDASVALEVAS